MKFFPKRDIWLSIVIWSCIIILFVAGLTPLFQEGAGIVGGTLILLFCFVIAGFIAWLWIETYYILNEDVLFVRMGPITKSIPVSSITKVKSTKSWIASAATSSQRILIHYGRYDEIYISPLNEELFVAELKKLCPHLDM
jgi:predicted ABC-type exoprotein transport system permease subunit